MISTIENIAGRRVTLAQIEAGCERYENASATLEQLIADLEADLEAVKQKHLRGLKKQASAVAGCQAELHGMIESAPQMFEKPRTITVHGVKVGYTSSEGKLEFDEEETVVKLIKQLHPRSAGMYLRASEHVNKDALKLLEPEDLKKLGCRITGAGEVVVLKRVAGDVEKLINKLTSKMVEAMVEGSGNRGG